MSTLAYAAVLVLLFIIGAFIFGYLEATSRTLKNGFTSLDKGIKSLRNIKILTLHKKSNKVITIGLSESGSPIGKNGSDDLKIYVHEY
ncbi:hypothetical protein CNR22_04665 [Sphingobacteriaceae bacterium]|nr:hypothetical protein CNR22_04665 [Sphingobacteriaceae bacterium]